MRPSGSKAEPVRETDILFVTDRMFWRRSIGSEQRIAALIDYAVARGDSVHVAYLGRLSKAERERVSRVEVHNLTIESRSIEHSLRSLTPSLLAAFPLKRASKTTVEEGSASRRAFVHFVLRRRRPRIVIVEFLRLIHTVHPRPPKLDARMRFVIDTQDLLHQRAARYREAGARVARDISAEDEMRALATFDAVLAIQEKEAALIKNALPLANVIVVRHGIDLPSVPTQETKAGPIRIGFLGGRDEANRSALEWFTQSVWPSLRETFGSAVELHVAGQICAEWKDPAEGLHLIGAVEKIDAFWTAIDIAINPVRFGSGLKIKNVEALAFARPLLTTTIGAEGLEGAGEKGIAIEDDPEAWILRLSSWIKTPSDREARGQAGRAFAETTLSQEAAFRDLSAFLDENLPDQKYDFRNGPDSESPIPGSSNGRNHILVLCSKRAFTDLVGPLSARIASHFVFVKPHKDREIRRILPTCRLVISKNTVRPDLNRWILIARRRGIPTLLVVDGPLEWANVFENPSLKQPGAEEAQSVFHPLTHDAVASISPAQSKWIESQNLGRGITYFDYANQRIRTSLPPDTPIEFDFLLTTARTASFHRKDHEALTQALKRCAEALRPFGSRVLVRLFDDSLETALREALPEASFESKGSFQAALAKSACLISPPSSVVLEAMVHSKPTAILHFRPHPLFYEAGFTIGPNTEIGPLLNAMRRRDEAVLKRQADSLAQNLSAQDFEREVLGSAKLIALTSPRPLDAADRAIEHRIQVWNTPRNLRYAGQLPKKVSNRLRRFLSGPR